jgi:rRNA processing protein Gar1
MSSILDTRFTINGIINSDRSVLDNLTMLCSACASWLTYDTHSGKFAVVINKPGIPTHSFDNNNIIGPINLVMTPLDKIYNTVKCQYISEELKGSTDYIQISIPPEQRFNNEFENVLNLNYTLVTDPVQAKMLASIELHQSRVDKIITFTSDFSSMGVKAGELISVTSDPLGFAAKLFRVISVAESDTDTGAIEIKITALEYDEATYTEAYVNRGIIDTNPGIPNLSALAPPQTPVAVVQEDASDNWVLLATKLAAVVGIVGLVDKMEFWIQSWPTPDPIHGSEWIKWKTSENKTNSFNQTPTSPILALGKEKDFPFSSFRIKTRSVNADGVSNFSDLSEIYTYKPKSLAAAMAGDVIVPVAYTQSIMNQYSLTSLGGPVGAWGWASAGEFQYDNHDVTVGGLRIPITSPRDFTSLEVVFQSIQTNCWYTTKRTPDFALEDRNMWGYIPVTMYVFYNGALVQTASSDWQTNTLVTNIPNAPAGNYEFAIYPLPTYDLNQHETNLVFMFNHTVQAQASGGGATLSIKGFL